MHLRTSKTLGYALLTQNPHPSNNDFSPIYNPYHIHTLFFKIGYSLSRRGLSSVKGKASRALRSKPLTRCEQAIAINASCASKMPPPSAFKWNRLGGFRALSILLRDLNSS